MCRFKTCEGRGTGIDKIINEIENYQLPALRFEQEQTYFRATIYAHKTLRQMNKEDKIRACYQHSCLQYVSNEVMTNESLRKRFDISESNYSIASKIIVDALTSKLIKPSDPESKSKKNTSYLPFGLSHMAIT
jgi:ATP-dependent DNA helicase RecG